MAKLRQINLFTFGNYSQSTPAIHLNNRLVPWVSKMKYLGLFFTAWDYETDLTNNR